MSAKPDAATPAPSHEQCKRCNGTGVVRPAADNCPRCDGTGIEPAPSQPAAREQWMEAAMEEIALLYIRSVVTKEQVDGVAVIARHYAAREGEEWISVSERLPKLFEVTEVQIKLRDGSILNEAIHQTDGDWWWQNRFLDAAEVTHWRPLPAAPNTSEAQR